MGVSHSNQEVQVPGPSPDLDKGTSLAILKIYLEPLRENAARGGRGVCTVCNSQPKRQRENANYSLTGTAAAAAVVIAKDGHEEDEEESEEDEENTGMYYMTILTLVPPALY